MEKRDIRTATEEEAKRIVDQYVNDRAVQKAGLLEYLLKLLEAALRARGFVQHELDFAEHGIWMTLNNAVGIKLNEMIEATVRAEIAERKKP